MTQSSLAFKVETQGRGLTDLTRQTTAWAIKQEMAEGLCTIFCPHTSASLLIQENADPDVSQDLEDFFDRLVPDDPSAYRHTTEGKDDMPAHIRSALTQSQLSIPLLEGELALGVWQGIFLFEHRVHPCKRTIILHLLGN